ncbi:MAG: hypothetical protein KIB00_09590 [Paeniclostridium sordellii]|nr:hypothetical protein [Paeniclostridium sordellii]
MIQVFDSEQYFEDMVKMESEYLEKFGLIPVDERNYDDLKCWFEDFKYECFGGGGAFVDYGYVPF